MTETDAPCLPDYTLHFHQSLLFCDASNLFNHRSLSAPQQRSGCRRQGGAKGGRSRRMFWELAPEDVLGKPADLSRAEVERQWKRRKNKMEKASRTSWTADENTPRAAPLREYTLKEVWEIFVNGRLFGAGALFRHVNVQSKAVFSYAMTMMDKIRIEKYLKKRMLSIMLCANWVCAGTFPGSRVGVGKCNFPA